jgi:hypothetical protein
MKKRNDDFPRPVIETLAKRSSYICSNPTCRVMTLAPSTKNLDKVIFVGKAAHITAASKGGPRYDASLTSSQRKSIKNGIFLCSFCADIIDKNKGIDFPVSELKRWKREHEAWVRSNLNKSFKSLEDVYLKKQLQYNELRTKREKLQSFISDDLKNLGAFVVGVRKRVNFQAYPDLMKEFDRLIGIAEAAQTTFVTDSEILEIVRDIVKIARRAWDFQAGDEEVIRFAQCHLFLKRKLVSLEDEISSLIR